MVGRDSYSCCVRAGERHAVEGDPSGRGKGSDYLERNRGNGVRRRDRGDPTGLGLRGAPAALRKLPTAGSCDVSEGETGETNAAPSTVSMDRRPAFRQFCGRARSREQLTARLDDVSRSPDGPLDRPAPRGARPPADRSTTCSPAGGRAGGRGMCRRGRGNVLAARPPWDLRRLGRHEVGIVVHRLDPGERV